MGYSLLLIHRDASVRKAVRSLLTDSGASITESSELRLSDLGCPDLVLIAWGALMPPADSLRWLKQRESSPVMRVIILANQEEYPTAVRALDLGADDCVVLPLQGEELVVRIQASLRRPLAQPSEETLSAGPIVLDRSVHRVMVRDKSVELAPTEFRLLAFLLENQGRVFSRNELLTRAWASNVKAGHRTVDVHVRRLRQQLEPFHCDEMIQTVRGFGYRLRADD
jgi:two-component system, OmpR family, phosphate regulon response regulator PhoB